MTERCQNKFTEKFDNFNYIIYIGILCTSTALLYFYKFHFVTIAFSYGLGCAACYYGFYSNISRGYVSKFKCHFVSKQKKKNIQDAPKKKCSACGLKDCERHELNLSTEPWVGLQIHKQLDQAIEDGLTGMCTMRMKPCCAVIKFYNTILEQFINTWYSKVTLQPFFVDELRHQLRYASACLLQRAVKVNYVELLTCRIVPCALRHVARGVRGGGEGGHVAVRSRPTELHYLRALADTLMPMLLRDNELQNPVFKVLIREIFAGWVLLSLTDVLATPSVLNTLICLVLGEEKMAPLPATPDYKVEFLETFARQTDSIYLQRCRLMKIDLEQVMADQEYFYAFMQYLKTTSHIYLLQFYKDIKSFQTKLLNPDLSESEKALLHKEASDIYDTYLNEESASKVPLQASIAEEIQQLLNSGDTVKRLQTSRALYQAARQSHAILEKILLPKFLHSEEFYTLIIGSRIPIGYQKQMTKKPHERLLQSAIKLGNKLRGALKSPTIDGRVLDTLNNDDPDSDSVDNVDILKYLDSIAAEQSLRGQDLSSYKVVLTDVETRLQAPPRRGTVRVFTLTVHRVESTATATASLWSVERSEHDFHLLRNKLHEFHGDHLLIDLPLPSRRDNSPLETLRYKYEDFLQRLLQKRLLQTSELLRIFLTEDGDFALVVQASTLNANSTDLVNIYQNVTYKFKKEKGQHLEGFLKNLLFSADMDRYQALKQGTHVEEALEVSEDVEMEQIHHRRHNKRDIRSTVFDNNMDVEDYSVVLYESDYQNCVTGFSQCCMYLLTNIINARSLLVNFLGTLFSLAKDLIDEAFNRYLEHKLYTVVTERRLAHLIRLGHGLLFNKKSSVSELEPSEVRELARVRLLTSVPSLVGAVCGAGLHNALSNAFDSIQQPIANKQLVYNLLDLCVVELFPELKPGSSKEPKS